MNISELYFRPKKWEGTGFIYELIGILIFKKWVVKMRRKSTKPNNYYLWQKNEDGLKKYERKTRYNELMHLAGILLPSIGLLKGGNDTLLVVTLWFVLIINVYPFFLQRYNRIRIYRILEKMNNLKTVSYD